MKERKLTTKLIIIIILLIMCIIFLLFNKKEENKTYTKYLTNLEQNIKTKYDDYNNNVINDSSEILNTTYSINITKKLDLMFKSNDADKKLDTNVLNMFLIEEGNGGFKYLYFIKKDGSLNKICIDCYKETNEFKIEKINKDNIVNVTQGLFDNEVSGYTGPIFIDLNGNILVN